jgi:hypothetical protein
VKEKGKKKVSIEGPFLVIYKRYVQLHVPFPSALRAPSLEGSTEAVEEILMTRAGSMLFESLIKRSERLMISPDKNHPL